MGEVWRQEAKRRIRLIVENVAVGFGARATCEITSGYPMLKNDDEMASYVQHQAGSFLGVDSVEEAPLWFAAEDFAYYLQRIPGAFFLLGVNRPDEAVTGLHTSTYSPDESSLRIGSSFLARLALSYCHQSLRS
jgi:metal-dependent amidase/aminoacylase/carboxypeptidase family protein